MFSIDWTIQSNKVERLDPNDDPSLSLKNLQKIRKIS
jgi:hypothetical protein